MLNPTRQIPVSSYPIVGADQILIEKYALFQEYGELLCLYFKLFSFKQLENHEYFLIICKIEVINKSVCVFISESAQRFS